MHSVYPQVHAYCVPRHFQNGATLLVALIFLLIFGAMAATALNTSLTSGQAIGNMQWRTEALAAAEDALDQILSSTDFATNTTVLTAQVNATPFKVDVNGDGTDDINVIFPAIAIDGETKAGPRCIRYRPIPVANLNPNLEADKGCFGTSAADQAGLGTAEATGTGSTAFTVGQSICASSEWIIPVRATDPTTSTSVTVTQGVGVRVFVSDAINQCK